MAILFTPPQCRAFSPPVFNNHATGETTPSPNSVKLKTSGAESWSSRFRSKSLSLVFSGALALGLSLSGSFHHFYDTRLNRVWIFLFFFFVFCRRRWSCRSGESGSKQTRTAPKRVHFCHRCCWFPLWWPGLLIMLSCLLLLFVLCRPIWFWL